MTCNTYDPGDHLAPDLQPGPKDHGHFCNFGPVIAEFHSVDQDRIAKRREAISEEEYRRCAAMGQKALADGQPRRDGRGPYVWGHRPSSELPTTSHVKGFWLNNLGGCFIWLILIMVLTAREILPNNGTMAGVGLLIGFPVVFGLSWMKNMAGSE